MASLQYVYACDELNHLTGKIPSHIYCMYMVFLRYVHVCDV
jgi:hypothetical protein